MIHVYLAILISILNLQELNYGHQVYDTALDIILDITRMKETA